MFTTRAAALVAALLLPRVIASPDLIVTGRIADQSSQPITGATITATPLSISGRSNARGIYTLRIPEANRGTRIELIARAAGYRETRRAFVLSRDSINVDLTLVFSGTIALADSTAGVASTRAAAEAQGAAAQASITAQVAGGRADLARMERRTFAPASPPPPSGRYPRDPGERYNREGYDHFEENPFFAASDVPRSTFSIDVDRASYSNVRRFLTQGVRPPVDAVRIEELVNYFPYEYDEPRAADPLAVYADVTDAPWKRGHKLVRIALQGRRMQSAELPPANFVFLIDVSGSMMTPNKLPLVKSALRLLVNEIREQDHVALVTYAGAAGLVLPSTSGDRKDVIMDAIERLEAGGSTAGGAGIRLAYDVARRSFKIGGNNRVILATDGDFNVGESSDGALVRLVEDKRREGTFLTVLGVGEGNLQDAKMKKLADHGNGNYAYIDNMLEARKVLVHELGGTLLTIAKDVKLQVEFNPTRVASYRLIGYENRLLRDQDFADDTKDAGELGAGHSVTALYEVVPVGVEDDTPVQRSDSLRYRRPNDESLARKTDELLYVKLRYKLPDAQTSKLLDLPVRDRRVRPSADFEFATAVAEFGLLLRNSPHKGNASWDDVMSRARRGFGSDEFGYRKEFLKLVEMARGAEVAKRG